MVVGGINMGKFNIKAWQDKHDSTGMTKGGLINNVDTTKAKSPVTEKKSLLKRKK
tara:strand:- start:1108 stop:1272 length:165 start_codon:yes stop_codon:yes gene_type:complete